MMSDASIIDAGGDLSARDLRIAIVAARFNAFIVDRLLQGAQAALRHHGAAPEDIAVVRVPGAFELPVAVAKLLDGGRYDAVVALGAVVRGDTPHFDYVAGECARGLSQLALRSVTPVAFGVLTTDTVEQALERAHPWSAPAARTGSAPAQAAKDTTPAQGAKDTTKGGNKGAEAAECAIEMARLMRRLEG